MRLLHAEIASMTDLTTKLTRIILAFTVLFHGLIRSREGRSPRDFVIDRVSARLMGDIEL